MIEDAKLAPRDPVEAPAGGIPELIEDAAGLARVLWEVGHNPLARKAERLVAKLLGLHRQHTEPALEDVIDPRQLDLLQR